MHTPKLRSVLTALALAGACLTTGSPTRAAPPATTYTVDAVHSAVLFKIKHLDVSWFYGFFTRVSGTIVHDAANPANSTVEITIPADSLFSNNRDRDAHLKGPDFFNTEQFPEITFRSTSVEGLDGGDLRVTGDLTLHGVTRQITFDAEFGGERDAGARFGYRAGWEATFTVNRSDYEMGFLAGPILGDEVTLTVSLEGLRQ
jgi:polyisoprenoid-binding protein YceI